MPVSTSYWAARQTTTSSRDVFPARSPRPLMQTWACSAPASMEARVLAVAWPRSLWAWALRGTLVWAFSSLKKSNVIRGVITPTVSGMLSISAPASSAALQISTR